MSREFSRNQRLGAQLQRTLSEVIRFETKDPGLANVSLTVVELSRDLSVATHQDERRPVCRMRTPLDAPQLRPSQGRSAPTG